MLRGGIKCHTVNIKKLLNYMAITQTIKCTVPQPNEFRFRPCYGFSKCICSFLATYDRVHYFPSAAPRVCFSLTPLASLDTGKPEFRGVYLRWRVSAAEVAGECGS